MSEAERLAVGVVTLSRLKQCLNEGYPVVFLFRYYWDNPPWQKYTDAQANRTLPYLAPLPAAQQHTGPPEGSTFGGHIVLAVGYDDVKKVVFCQNSWGEGTAKVPTPGAPIFAMDYSWITGELRLCPLTAFKRSKF
jgi:hypothetical protein